MFFLNLGKKSYQKYKIKWYSFEIPKLSSISEKFYKQSFLKLFMKKRYKIALDEKVVDETKSKTKGSKISPLVNNLLKVWGAYKSEVESLYHKLKRDEKTNSKDAKKKEIVSELKKISGEK